MDCLPDVWKKLVFMLVIRTVSVFNRRSNHATMPHPLQVLFPRNFFERFSRFRVLHAMTRIDLIRRLPAGTIGYEIGVLTGEFSAQILSTPVKKLILVDEWRYHRDDEYRLDPANCDQGGQDMRYEAVCKRFDGDSRVDVIRTDSTSWRVYGCMQTWPPDWVFIDANHTYEQVILDLRFYAIHCDRMFAHDYVDNEASQAMGFGVKRAVDNFCRAHGWRINAITDEEWPTVELLSPNL